MEGLSGYIFGLVLLVVGASIYFLPAMIAVARRHPSLVPVVMLNVLLGWTILGWIAALMWGLSGPGKAEGPSEKTFRTNWPQS